jgi:putative glutamine amidotransferase
MAQRFKPLIGIPSRSMGDDGGAHYVVRSTYTRAVEIAGGAPVVIPLQLSDDTLRAIFERLDGLLLAGGLDVHPREFGEEVARYCGEIDAARDETELRITRWALAAEKPIFGICRGIQLLNVAAGGSLYQDIPAQLKTDLWHQHRKGEPYNLRAHEIEVDANSRVAHALGATALEVNSLHHQALKKIGAGLKVVARAPDGVVEAIEARTPEHFVVGVQFHPEWLLDDDARMRHLFEHFVASAREYHYARNNGHEAAATPSRE